MKANIKKSASLNEFLDFVERYGDGEIKRIIDTKDGVEVSF